MAVQSTSEIESGPLIVSQLINETLKSLMGKSIKHHPFKIQLHYSCISEIKMLKLASVFVTLGSGVWAEKNIHKH